MRIVLLFLLLAAGTVFLSGCASNSMFYFPDKFLYVDPAKTGVRFEPIKFPARDGKTLTGFYFFTSQKPLGTVVHFHGNAANVTNHFPLALFLVNHGFDVLAFDYEGYGLSEGTPTPLRTVEDGLAAVDFAYERCRSENKGVVILGQSLGAAVASVVAAKDGRVKAVVLEAGFTSYKSIARAVIGRSVLLWPFYPIYPTFFVNGKYDPVKFIGRIAPRPILFIHGDKDEIIPVEMSRILFQKAGEPKTLWIVPNAKHLGCKTAAGNEYDERVARFFQEALSSIKKRGSTTP